MDPAVIVAVLDEEGRLLLGHHAGWEDTRVSILAGFVEAGNPSNRPSAGRSWRSRRSRWRRCATWAASRGRFPRSLMLGFVASARGQEVRADGEEILWARFFTRAEVTAQVADGSLTLPMRSSIASRIITAWRDGEIGVEEPAAD
jgi:NAD+ diphosphatase